MIGPVRLTVIGEVPAGGVADRTVDAGTAIRIATGAPLPAGADAVVPVELTTPLDAGGSPLGPRGRDATGPLPPACAVHAAVDAGSSIRRRGEDIREGSEVLAAGTPMTPAAIALAAGAGADAVAVHRRPRVAVLATGDEVRAPGEPLGPAGIPDANGPGLRALASAAGARVVDLGIARDDLDDVLTRLRHGIDRADAVIVSGGVSVGPYDVVKRAFETVGRVDLWRVAVQPGKPFAFGVADDGPVLFGLPGNPVSGFVTFELFVRPAIRRLAGHPRLLRDGDTASCSIRWRRRRAGAPISGRSPSATMPAARSATPGVASGSGSPAARAATSSRRSPPPTRWPSSPRPSTRSRPAPRSTSSGSIDREPAVSAPRRPDRSGDAGHLASPDQPEHAERPADLDAPAISRRPPMDRKPAPRAERRRLTHVDRTGRPRMVDVSAKPPTARRAVAEAFVACSAETLSLVIDGATTKGDVLTVAELAGVMGGKRTSELIPLCHPLALTDLVVQVVPDRAAGVLRIRAEAATAGPPGSRWRP